MQSYKIVLYDSSKSQIDTSGTLYDVDDITMTISNLEDNTSYYVKGYGETLNGMSIETEHIPFIVDYIVPSLYSLLVLENISDEGKVLIRSNVKSIECKTENDPEYIDDEYLVLTDNKVYMDEDFSLDDDFTINIKGYNFSEGQFFKLQGDDTTINLYMRQGTYAENDGVEMTFVEMKIPVAFTTFYIMSNFIENPSETDILSIWLERKSSYYRLVIKNLSATSE